MSEFPHDDFSKAFLSELLNRIGNAKADFALQSETLSADLWFEYNPRRTEEQVKQLGLLGQLMTKDHLIEVFRNPATLVEIRACQRKLSQLEERLINQARKRGINLQESQLPHLCLVMPTASEAIRSKFAAVGSAYPGVYHFPEGLRVSLIVVHQLSLTEETLWLRMLGRNGNQQRAIREFSHTPTEPDLYASIEEILASYRTNLESRRQLTSEEEVLVMQLSEAYLKKRQEWKEEGVQQVLQAIDLLRQGIDISSVAKTTGLSIETLEKIRTRERNNP